MAVDLPLDEKARRMRELLSSFYSQNQATSNGAIKSASLDAIDSPSFDADQFMDLLIKKSNLEGLLQRHVEMAAEIKNLDTDLQMLVYENYNKFISATETIKRMNNNIAGMETNMEQLLEKIMSVQSKSDGVNTSLFERREHIEKLNRTRNLLRKVQFIYDLPARLAKCIKSEAYADAVRFYIGAMPIFEAYGESSFQDCKKESEQAMAIVTRNLQAKLSLDSEPVEARAEAAVLLKQLNYPVDDLKSRILEEKLEHLLLALQHEAKEPEPAPMSSDVPPVVGMGSVSPDPHSNKAFYEFAKTVRAYRVIFPDSERRPIELARNLFLKRFETIQKHIEKKISSVDLLAMLRLIWNDVLIMDEVLPEAALPSFASEAASVAINQYVSRAFSYLLSQVSDALTGVNSKQKGGSEGENLLQIALESGKKVVTQGSMDLLLELRQLMDDDLVLVARLKDLYIDWVQEGLQGFFRALDDYFLMLSGKSNPASQGAGSIDGIPVDKVLPGLILVLVQLSVFIEQNAIPRITEEIAASFSGGGARGYEDGPPFVPAEVCRIFRSAGEKFLHVYISMKTKKISVLLKKRFTTPNWVKHKEPREVHMFVDLLLQELEAVRAEVKQVLPHGVVRKHHRSDSTGSTNSSRSNPIRDDKMGRSNTQRARSQLLESHLAKLFKQKMEIFTKVEYTQESVVSTIVKLCLKSFQEFVRLQTFNRSGFQQVQLDSQFLRIPLKEIVEDEAAIDFLLDEVLVAGAERCLDPIPLESAILDKLIQAKLARS
ncbi:vacuolar protein sorting-associated protein 51 homolog [Amborella trichopoda]|uniref:Vacuolar protein sorting-associated protein 51 homolog n=1 Tax=Amborella trichopoda TaxID=13333 RepID=W1NWX6_AMBTC|nr:vacuolar protein sorting-associated protein 51 homolog [Amborella trichopoda]ERN02137.1 hypothetical protein AMTR_s00045p00178420 [Amborella trichopoda]|eukprot:XP_006840462.1 vacuolar protein sorting-associated protein 51 homolog [Amborella trichopoda]